MFPVSEWARKRKINESFENLSVTELNKLMRKFWAEVRKGDGKRYGVKSMNNLRYGIQRHLNQPPFSRNILSYTFAKRKRPHLPRFMPK